MDSQEYTNIRVRNYGELVVMLPVHHSFSTLLGKVNLMSEKNWSALENNDYSELIHRSLPKNAGNCESLKFHWTDAVVLVACAGICGVIWFGFLYK